MSDRPRFGARCTPDGVRFGIWAPGRERVEVLFEGPGKARGPVALADQGQGIFAGLVRGARPGEQYRYRLDQATVIPDPASRAQPDGVHGPSEIIDPSYDWSDHGWRPPAPEQLVVYELHVGTFTPAGTFAGVREQLPYLQDLGITAIELMPVADFPGRWNWGYDGACLYAPARCYGRPDDLRALVDAAHRTGIAVLLDVVYNHLGPDGAYLAVAAPTIFSDRHATPWGRAINLDGPGSRQVRDLLIDNAIHWVEEYHVDGLRLDATHALIDDSPRHFLAELADRVRADTGRPVVLIAEDHGNLAHLVRPPAEGGFGLDGEWSDDLHHQVRRITAGDQDGYYRDFTDSPADLARTIRQGWFFTGQPSSYFHGPRGTDPAGLAPARFTTFIQNHDQIGNRGFGERLHHQIEPAVYRAVSALLLMIPETPLLFMGQEWSCATPFRYFTDHEPDLGHRVTDGRREELARWAAFRDAAARARTPDPQDPATFDQSRLDWAELRQPAQAAAHRLYRELIARRRRSPLVIRPDWEGFHAAGDDGGALWFGRRIGDEAVLVLVRLRGSGLVDPRVGAVAPVWEGLEWSPVLSTEDPTYTADPMPIEAVEPAPAHTFARPGALVLTGHAPTS